VQGREGVRQVIAALDVGGTHVSAARVDLESARVEPLVRLEYEPHADRPVLLQAILTAASAVAAPAVAAVGVSVPGPFDYDTGVCTIRGVGKLEALYGLDLRGELAHAFGVRGAAVVFLNDAEAFLLGEAGHGAARGHARAVGLTLGTGLGSAFLADGAIVRGGAGVPQEGSLHLLAFRGAPVEERISARGLRARSDGRDVRELALAARAGDASAQGAFSGYSADLADFLDQCLRAFAPTCLVVGGSISRAWDLIGPALVAAFPHVEVNPSALLDEAPLLGAARYALSTSALP
jgi:glucokinase